MAVSTLSFSRPTAPDSAPACICSCPWQCQVGTHGAEQQSRGPQLGPRPAAKPAKPQQSSLAAKLPRPGPSRPVQCRPMPRLLVKAILRLMLADCLEPTAGMLYITRRFQTLRGEAVIMSGLSLGLEVAQQASNPSQLPALTPPMLNSFLWFLAQRRPSPEAVAAQLSSEQQLAAAEVSACQSPTSPPQDAACAPAGSLPPQPDASLGVSSVQHMPQSAGTAAEPLLPERAHLAGHASVSQRARQRPAVFYESKPSAC